MSNRIARLQALMAGQGIDAIALVPSANLFYLTGLQMQLSERVTLALILRDGEIHLIAPALEVPRIEARARVPTTLHAWKDTEGVKAGWASLARVVSLKELTIGVDYYAVRVLELLQLQEVAQGMKLVDASPLLTELRMSKDAEEVAAMRRAVQVLETSLEALLQQIKPGQTEKEIAAHWQWLMREHGADGIPAEPIVAAGPNSAMPHTTATDRAIGTGELLILDGWCTVDGYFGDITRTVAIGQVSEELQRIYEVTRAANEAGRNAVKPGRECQEVDLAARQVIEQGGYGQYILHRTGHGLGLEVHEMPSMVEGNTLPMRVGMTFTIEPGIYVAGQGGARIEDDILVTQDGGESLTHLARELVVI